MKYSVYPNELFQALISAENHGKSVCGELAVEYRGKIKNENIFLITKDNNVAAQLRVVEELLLKKDTSFESWMSTDKIRRKIAKQHPVSSFALIKNLRAGMKRINLKAEVLTTSKPELVHTQFGGNIMLANVLIGDETGKVKLCLWGEQVSAVAVGDTIQVTNAHVCLYKGETQLRLGKSSALNVLKSKSASVTEQPCSLTTSIQ